MPTFLAPDSAVAVSPLEFELLCALWIHGACVAKEAVDEVNLGREFRKEPRITFMDGSTALTALMRRSIIYSTKKTQAGVSISLFQAVRTEDEFLGDMARQFLAAYFGGELRNMVDALEHQTTHRLTPARLA